MPRDLVTGNAALVALALWMGAGCGERSDAPLDAAGMAGDAAIDPVDSVGPGRDAEARDDPGAGTSPEGGMMLAPDDGGAPPLERDAASETDVLDAGNPFEGSPPYGESVAGFEAGSNAGFGEDELPGVVLGPPIGGSTVSGSLDVLSLGVGGEIEIAFGDRRIVDGPGADFIVFENAFWPGGDATQVFAELGEVAVSEDGDTWHAFECDTDGAGQGRYPGCAGWTPMRSYDPMQVRPLDPEVTGGDAFDLADLGVESARFVRVRDLASSGQGMTAGFDLDAIGVIHFETLP